MNHIWIRRKTRRNLITSVFLLLPILVFAGCDPPQGPKVGIANQTEHDVLVYVDVAPLDLIGPEGELQHAYVNYSFRISSFESGEQRAYHISSAAFLPPETQYIVTGVTGENTALFQQLVTGAELEAPDALITIHDQRGP